VACLLEKKRSQQTQINKVFAVQDSFTIVPRMRALALIAFMGLQLSMFTCGIDIHIDHLDDTTSQIAHLDDSKGSPGHGLMDNACQMHASSHVFTDQKAFLLKDSKTPSKRIYHLATLSFVSIPHLIEHPPQLLYG